MASLITHPIVPLAAAGLLGRRVIPTRLLVLGALFAALPDLDGIAFRLGIPYASDFGHRGFSHSIVVALCCAIFALPLARTLSARPLTVFLFLFFSMLSHGVLDAMTDGGKGIAFFWPFSSERIFFSFRPLEVSPVSAKRFLTARGWQVLRSELMWIWAPTLLLALAGGYFRLRLRARQPDVSADSDLRSSPESV